MLRDGVCFDSTEAATHLVKGVGVYCASDVFYADIGPVATPTLR
jgi:uncharacterized protein YcbK (DUF882 family)